MKAVVAVTKIPGSNDVPYCVKCEAVLERFTAHDEFAAYFCSNALCAHSGLLTLAWKQKEEVPGDNSGKHQPFEYTP